MRALNFSSNQLIKVADASKFNSICEAHENAMIPIMEIYRKLDSELKEVEERIFFSKQRG